MKRMFLILSFFLLVFVLKTNAFFPEKKNHFKHFSWSSYEQEIKEKPFSQIKSLISHLSRRPAEQTTQKKFSEAHDTDEVETALRAYPGFKKLTKFPGLADEIKTKLKKNFLPELGSPAIIEEQQRSQYLDLLVGRLLALHTVSEQCEIVIVRSRVPSVLTWKLTFITFTDAAVNILNDEEIIALAGHELGHLYYAVDLADARANGDNRRARVIELKADIVALETLDMLGIQRINLISAVKKLIQARTTLGLKSTTEMSASIEDRARLVTEYKPSANTSSKGCLNNRLVKKVVRKVVKKGSV